MQTLYPELAKEWHPINNNGILPSEVMPKTNKKYWWICSICKYEWQDTPNHRSYGRKCPKCSKVENAKQAQFRTINEKNRLSTNFPEIARTWNYEKNGDLHPNEITSGSTKKYGGYVRKDMNGKIPLRIGALEETDALTVQIIE